MEKETEHRLTELEALAKKNKEDIETLGKRQDDLDDLVSTVKVLADREKRVETDVAEIKNDVKELTNKPAKRWDKIVETIIIALLTGVLGFILARLGMGG